ncbi:MAG TPA: inositol 2-dehydrogenase, partial [Phenylobacterium sp.]
RIEAFGSAGMAVAGDAVQDAVQVWREPGAMATPLYPGFMTRYAEAYRTEMDHFADVLDGAARPETGYAASVASLTLAEAAARSVATGAPVRLQGT